MRALSIATTLSLLAPGVFADGNIQLVSIGLGGASANGDTEQVAMSANGRFVAFTSNAPDLVSGDTNGIEDVFVRDMVTGEIKRISASTAGVEGDGASGRPDISADGNVIVFESNATNLVSTPDLNGYTDIYRHDLALGVTTRVSVTLSSSETDGESTDPVVSGDGAVVAFRSEATNLLQASADTNGVADVFSTTLIGLQRVSVTSTGAEADGWSGHLFGIDISFDGQHIVYASAATNLVPGDTNGWVDIFVRDQLAGTVERVSLTGAGGEGDKSCRSCTISDDGDVVAFDSASTNLVPGDTNDSPDCFVLVRSTNSLKRISVTSDGIQGSSYSVAPFVSADGAVVCFQSFAPELDGALPGTGVNVEDVFRYEVSTGELSKISVGTNGPGNNDSYRARPSGNGAVIAMASYASNFDPADTNGEPDAFLVISGEGGGTGVSFCDSVNSIGCPCGNPGAEGEGCANGTGSGAKMRASGAASVKSSSLSFSTVGLIPGQPGLYFQGNNAVSGGQGILFGDGVRCAGGGVIRLQVRFAGDDGTSQTTADIAAVGGVSPGDIKRYQLWYRDPITSPCGSLFNLTNGLEVTWGP